MRLVRSRKRSPHPRIAALPAFASLLLILVVILTHLALSIRGDRATWFWHESELPLEASSPLPPFSRPLTVQLEADADGYLERIHVRDREFSTDDRGLSDLNRFVRQVVGMPSQGTDWRLEIDPSANLRMEELLRVADACLGRVQVDPKGHLQTVLYFDAIRLAPPRTAL